MLEFSRFKQRRSLLQFMKVYWKITWMLDLKWYYIYVPLKLSAAVSYSVYDSVWFFLYRNNIMGMEKWFLEVTELTTNFRTGLPWTPCLLYIHILNCWNFLDILRKCIYLQNVWRGRSEIREKEMDSLFWRCDSHHLYCSNEWIWSDTGRGPRNGMCESP